MLLPAAPRRRSSRRPTESQVARHPKRNGHGWTLPPSHKPRQKPHETPEPHRTRNTGQPKVKKDGKSQGRQGDGAHESDLAATHKERHPATTHDKSHTGGTRAPQNTCRRTEPTRPGHPEGLITSSSSGRAYPLLRPRAKPNSTSPTKPRPHTPPSQQHGWPDNTTRQTRRRHKQKRAPHPQETPPKRQPAPVFFITPDHDTPP